MSTKLTKKTRLSRAALPALLALLFAGSAMAVAASALDMAIPAAPLYLAALVAVALCALAGLSRGGAALSAAAFLGVGAAYIAGNAPGLSAAPALFAAWTGQAAQTEQALLGGRTLLTCGAFALAALFYALLNRRELVSPAIMLLLAILVCCHAMSPTASIGAAVPGLVAAAAAFALTGGIQRDVRALRTLVPACAVVALAVALSPAARVTWPPLEDAANRVRSVFEQYFHFTRERVAFSINEQGYDHAGEVGDAVVSMLGGPAQPHTDPMLKVRTDADVLLRGAIRTAYTGYSWVDAEPKSRYLYVDLTHRGIRDRVFAPAAAVRDAIVPSDVSVEALSEGTSTLFVPGYLERFSMDLSTAVYYNTAGEMFLTRQVQPGDRYSLRALTPRFGEALRQAVIRGADADDGRYQQIMAGHLQLPEGIDGGVYALTMRVIEGRDNAYDRAVAIRDYLRDNMRYTLEPEYPPLGRDFVSHFLLDTQKGYCSYYASAMAVMGRIAGLPTRYVEGYLAPADREVLTGENAHAWAEVYFRGVGWIPFDATGGAVGAGQSPEEREPDGGEENAGGEAGELPAEGELLPDATPTPTPSPAPDPGAEGESAPTDAPTDAPADEPPDEPEAGPDAPPEPEPSPEADAPQSLAWLWGALLVLLAALIALAVRWTRKRLRAGDPAVLVAGAKSEREAAMILYRANLTALARLGQSPAGGEAPEAFARRVAEQLNNPDYAAFVRAVAGAAYGRRSLAQEDVDAGLRAYGAFLNAMSRRERLRFAAARVFRGLGDFEQIP